MTAGFGPATWDTPRVRRTSAVAERNALLEKRRNDTVIPLELSAWREHERRAEEELKTLRDQLDNGPARFTVQSIPYDGESKSKGDPRVEAQLAEWRKDLAKNAWVEQALHVLSDMAPPAKR